MARGRFITLEGGEGVGKSTQARRLADTLKAQGRTVLLTREPGGTPGAEAIRALLVSGDADRWDGWAEALLLNAARADHVRRAIEPALARGDWVVCDRFVDSTLVYQGLARGLGTERLVQLHDWAVGLWPDRTLVLTMDSQAALTRARGVAPAEQRFESEGTDFHARLALGFAQLADAFPERCRIVRAEGDPDTVTARLLAAL
ncbi:MAG: dTMP kinase [Sphingomonadales bacterium]|nr:MAG: dTMP kinase [Sphingomonadales bacterium]